MTFDEILAKLLAMNFRERASIKGARVYYRAGHSFQGDGGPTVTIGDVRCQYEFCTDAARSIDAGRHVDPIDGRIW